MNNLAPVIVFAYNRPWHLEQTLNALKENELADKSTVFIYSDGPKPNASEDERRKISKVRNLAHKQKWCKELHVIESEINKGLGTSIINGTSEIIKKYGKVIVLEDDLVTSKIFLHYMNKALDYYSERKSVFSISALSRPDPNLFFPKDYKYDVYVSLTHHPTGWGTWLDRWKQVDWNTNQFSEIKNDSSIKNAFCRAGYGLFHDLENQILYEKNIWSIRFALAHFVNHAISICPIVSYIHHIGWDNSGTNASISSRWQHKLLADNKDIRFLNILYEDSRIINSWYSFSISQRRSFTGRILNRIGHIFLRKDEFILKGKVYDH